MRVDLKVVKVWYIILRHFIFFPNLVFLRFLLIILLSNKNDWLKRLECSLPKFSKKKMRCILLMIYFYLSLSLYIKNEFIKGQCSDKPYITYVYQNQKC